MPYLHNMLGCCNINWTTQHSVHWSTLVMMCGYNVHDMVNLTLIQMLVLLNEVGVATLCTGTFEPNLLTVSSFTYS